MKTHKACSKCGEIKPVGEFNRDRRLADGLKSQCRGCCREYRRRYYLEHAEAQRADARKYRQEHREYYRERSRQYSKLPKRIESNRLYMREYNRRNRELLRQKYQERAEERRRYAREYRLKHRDKYIERSRQNALLPEQKERQRRWKLANREAVIAYHKQYRENKPYVAAAGSAVLTAVRRGDLPPVSQCECFMCGKQAQHYHHVDYSKPLDVFPVCISCHKRWHSANEAALAQNAKVLA